jgi:hypothetical protein
MKDIQKSEHNEQWNQLAEVLNESGAPNLAGQWISEPLQSQNETLLPAFTAQVANSVDTQDSLPQKHTEELDFLECLSRSTEELSPWDETHDRTGDLHGTGQLYHCTEKLSPLLSRRSLDLLRAQSHKKGDSQV